MSWLHEGLVLDISILYFREDFATYIFTAGILVSFILSFAVGANDSANSWGTCVGAGSISLGWAYFLGSIMETVGCTVLSGNVIKNLVNGIVNTDAYTSNQTEIKEDWELWINNTHGNPILGDYPENSYEDERILMLGCLAVMLSSGLWQLIASAFSWPVSGTHCTIFGLLGFTLAAKGGDGVQDVSFLILLISMLVISVVAAMFAVALIYYPLYKYCIRSGSPFEGKNRIIFGFLTGFAIVIPAIFVVFQVNKTSPIFGADAFSFDFADELIIIFGFGVGISLVIAVLSTTVLLPRLSKLNGDFVLNFDIRFWRKKKDETPVAPLSDPKLLAMKELEPSKDVKEIKQETEKEEEGDSIEIRRVFRPLQILSAMSSSLVHGGNDVGNCIGPVVLMYLVYKGGVLDADKADAPLLIALLGGVGISLGLTFFGERVIITVGSGLSEMTPSRGFVVEFTVAVLGLLFTFSGGWPISTTHMKVGGVIGAGLVQGLVETGSPKQALKFVNFNVLSGVALSWVLTVPVSMGLSALLFYVLKLCLL